LLHEKWFFISKNYVSSGRDILVKLIYYAKANVLCTKTPIKYASFTPNAQVGRTKRVKMLEKFAKIYKSKQLSSKNHKK